MEMHDAVLGREVIVPVYGQGMITEIKFSFPPYIGVTPHVAGYQMKFNPENVTLADPIRGRRI